MNELTDNKVSSASRTKTIAYVGVSIALIAVCSWIVVPIGPIPITLQMFAIPLLIFILQSNVSIIAICAYLIFGIAGLPLFSGFHGGIGVLLGPTGGYLIGYIPGTIFAAYIVRWAKDRFARNKPALIGFEFVAGLVFTLFAYLIGWIQYACVAGISLQASFAVSVAPFIVLDIIKVIVAVFVAQLVNEALNS